MNARRVRIVVGEGRSSRQGLLRFVLDGEGYDVVADAANAAELARVLAAHKPDAVVLDDGIGATAVGMVREMVPEAKVVLVWPGAVVPIGGAAQVPPSRVLQELGPAVAKVTGVAGVTPSATGTAMVDRVKDDPAERRRMIGEVGAATAMGAVIDDSGPAPVVKLPVTPSVDDDLVTVPEAAAGIGIVAAAATGGGEAGTGASIVEAPFVAGAKSDLNRRLGNLALGGAAVAGAIVLALALGGAKVPIAQVSGQAYTFSPPAAPGPREVAGGPTTGHDSLGAPGGSGQGQGNGSVGGTHGYDGTLGFYPIQPYISALLPIDGLSEGAGGPLPPVEIAERTGDHPQHDRATGTNRENEHGRGQAAAHGKGSPQQARKHSVNHSHEGKHGHEGKHSHKHEDQHGNHSAHDPRSS
jgi:hypothetical protein